MEDILNGPWKAAGWLALVVLIATVGFEALKSDEVKTAGDSQAREKATAFITLLSSGRFTQAATIFDEKMTEGLPPEKLELVWKALQMQLGSFNSTGETWTNKRKGHTIVFVRCLFERGSLLAKVVYNPKGRIAGLFFVPDPNPPKRTEKERPPKGVTEVEITVKTGEWKLPGTLSMPSEGGPFPALVLVHGSGPQDRDESLGPNRPFRDLAWGLGQRGIAVLRYEKRTRQYAGKMAGLLERITVKEETVDDAVSAVELLAGHAKIAPKKVFVLGHSLGGTVIPRIAEGAPKAAGFIILAGAARPLEDVIVDQVRYIHSLDGSLSSEEKVEIAGLEKKAQLVKELLPLESTPATMLPLSIGASYWLDLTRNSPVKGAAGMTRPLLLLQGERDYQVTLDDWKLWQEGLRGRKRVKFILYPDLNHLFMEGVGMATPEEYTKPGKVSEKVLDDVAAWMKSL